jgi:pilus assembly protein Flp/PilA
MSIVDRLFVNLLSRLSAEDGQGLAEYGLILALVAVVVVGAVTLLGTNVGNTLTSVASSI